MDLDIGSKETETLIKALGEFKNGPDDLSSLVQALRQKGYCRNQSGAYRYGHRILEIRKIFTTKHIENPHRTDPDSTLTPEQAHKDLEEMERQGIPFLLAIHAAINDSNLSMTQKRQFCESRLQKLSNIVAKDLGIETKEPERTPAKDVTQRYNYLHEHGWV